MIIKRKTLVETKSFLDNVGEELQSLSEIDRMEMYRMLADYGDNISLVHDDERTPENFVRGCISQVYIGHTIEKGYIQFRGYSEAIIVRGYLSILIQALSGLLTKDILLGSKLLIENFYRQVNVQAYLTPNRANAFTNIYYFMRKKAGE